MKKQYVGMGVLVLVVIAAGWYFVSLNEPKAAPVVTPAPHYHPRATTTPGEVATGTTSKAPTTSDEIELDLTKLQGKDRLYTEEEGKYENLSEEERRKDIHRNKSLYRTTISSDIRKPRQSRRGFWLSHHHGASERTKGLLPFDVLRVNEILGERWQTSTRGTRICPANTLVKIVVTKPNSKVQMRPGCY
jgi:hypothetical protein